MRYLLLVLCFFGLLPAAGAETRPNFLIVLADDMGYSDAGCYGGEVATPNLDSLAEGGLRYAQFYSTGRCWPSRAALMTSYYAQQVRRDAFSDEDLGGRPAWAPLLSTVMKEAGYRCYHTGKWHLDGEPLVNGFDRSYSLQDQDRVFSPKVHFLDGVPLPQPGPESGYYATRVIADYAVDFLKEHAANHPDQPFLHYLAFTAPHFPLHALPEDIARYRDRFLAGWDTLREARWKRLCALGLIDCPLSEFDPAIIPPYNVPAEELAARIGAEEVAHAVPWDSLTDAQRRFQATKMAIHAAMVDRMDRELGRVLEQLKAMGAYENTVVLFMSDNGASAEQLIRGEGHEKNAAPGSAGSYLCLGPGFSSLANTPFRLHKIWTNEGGISSPLIIHWPAGIAARGEVRQQVGHFIDVFPTILEIAGVARPGLSGAPEAPGRSLVASFSQDNSVERPYLWWLHEGRAALREGDWKVVKREDETAWALYDLAVDRSEMKNLAEEQPEVAARLAGMWAEAAEQFRGNGRQ
jgi:arylsulfatase A-like enzyme